MARKPESSPNSPAPNSPPSRPSHPTSTHSSGDSGPWSSRCTRAARRVRLRHQNSRPHCGGSRGHLTIPQRIRLCPLRRTGPVPHWSGGAHGRLRAHKGGNRRLNSALHQAALVRIKAGGPWADEYRRRRESDSHPRVMRRLNASWHGRCISASATATPDTRSRRPSPSSCAANVVATFPHGRPQHTAARDPAPPTAKPTGGRDRCGVCGADRPQPRLVDRPRTRALTSQHRWRSVERPTLWG